MRRALKIDFVRFCMVGGLGFLINFALLTLLYKVIGLPVFFAQLLSSEVALFNNFLLHHNWTYSGHKVDKTLGQLLVQFHATSWAAILGSSLLVSLGVNVLKLNYLPALAIASVVALTWNFFWTKFFIWKKHNKENEEAT